MHCVLVLFRKQKESLDRQATIQRQREEEAQKKLESTLSNAGPVVGGGSHWRKGGYDDDGKKADDDKDKSAVWRKGVDSKGELWRSCKLQKLFSFRCVLYQMHL